MISCGGADLVQHAEQQVLEQGRDLRPVGETQGLVLDDLEELEDIWGVEGDAPKHKGVEAGSQGVHVCRSAPAPEKSGIGFRHVERWIQGRGKVRWGGGDVHILISISWFKGL